MQPAAASISTKVLWRVGCFIGVCFHKKSGSFRLPDLVGGDVLSDSYGGGL